MYGSNIGHTAGKQNTDPGNNVAAITVIIFLKTILEVISAGIIGFAFQDIHWRYTMGIQRFSIMATGSVSLTHGPNTGPTTGTIMTMCI
jgi:hypothetical protein